MLVFLAHLNCQRVKTSSEFLVLSSSGQMLYRAAPYFAMRVMSRASLNRFDLCFGMIWFLNNAAHGGIDAGARSG